MKKLFLIITLIFFSCGIANAKLSIKEAKDIEAQIMFKKFEKEIHQFYEMEKDLKTKPGQDNSNIATKAVFFYNDVYIHVKQEDYKWLMMGSPYFSGVKNWEVAYHRWANGSTSKAPHKVIKDLMNSQPKK